MPPEKSPLLPPKTEAKTSFNVTFISVSQNENGVILKKPDEEEDDEEEEVEETEEEASKEDKGVTTTTAQPATTLPADDNLSYICE